MRTTVQTDGWCLGAEQSTHSLPQTQTHHSTTQHTTLTFTCIIKHKPFTGITDLHMSCNAHTNRILCILLFVCDILLAIV